MSNPYRNIHPDVDQNQKPLVLPLKLHQHQFNIPVEFETNLQYPGNGKSKEIRGWHVTKLKCTGCNEEQDR